MKTFVLLFVLSAAVWPQTPTNDECDDDNENVSCCFINAPKQLSHIISIADRTEPGERLHLTGIARKADGRTPVSGLVIYAYHTNTNGIYPKKGNEVGIHTWHGYLHSWGKTNERGEFEIRSIRPAQYPSNNTPAHIHLVVKEPGGAMYYVKDIMFSDDPLVRDTREEGVVEIKKSAAGIWKGAVAVRLRR